MKETIIKNFIFLNLAVFIYSLGWFFKSNFYLSFIFFIMSFFLFLFLFKNKNYNSIVLPGENIKQPFILFWFKTLIILIFILVGFKLFNYKKDLFANIFILAGMLQLAFLFKGDSAKYIENLKEHIIEKQNISIEERKKIFTKSLIVLFILSFFILVIYLSYLMAKGDRVFTSALLLLFGICGLGYFYSIIEKEKFLIKKKLIYENIWFNLIILFILSIVGLALRIYKINAIPDGYSLDEQIISAYAGPVMQNHRIDMFIADVRFQVASLYYYLIGQLWKFITPSIDNARIVSAIIGVINIIFTYLLVFELFKNKRMALLSAFFMTFSYYHLIYSRIAWLWIFVPTLAAITFYFYLLGERTGKFIYYVIAGIFMGINLYFYNAAKMVPFIFVLYWLFLILNNKEQRNFIFNNKRALFLFILSSLIVFIPLAIYIIKYPQFYFDRIRGESIFRGQKLSDILSPAFLNFFFSHAKDTLLMYIYKASPYGYYNYPNKPLLDSISGFLYLLGFGYALYNFKNSRYFLLLLIFLFSLVPAFFSIHASDPNTQRAILSVVPIVIFISLGAEMILKSIDYLKIKITPLLNLTLLLIFFPFIIFDNLHTYFYLYKNDNDVKAEFFYVPSKVIKHVNASKDYFNYGSFFYLETPNFHVNKGIFFKFFDFAAMRFFEWKGDKGKGVQFILEGIYNKTADIVKEYIPEAVITRHWDPYSEIENRKYFYRVFDEFNPRLLFISIVIPEEAIKLFHSLNVRYSDKNGKNILGDIKINMAEIPVMKDAHVVEITSLIDLPYYTNYKFYCLGVENYDIFIDDKKIKEEKLFAAGLHKFKVTFNPQTQQNIIINWECKEFGLAGKIPSEYFVNAENIYGLKGEYFIQNEKVSEQIDPIITHRVYFMSGRIKAKKWQNQHDIIWSGKIYVPEKNISYILDTDFDSYIEIDKQIIFKIKDKEKMINFFKSKPGWHDIKIYYSYKGLGLLAHKLTGVKFLYKTENMKLWDEVPFNYLKP